MHMARLLDSSRDKASVVNIKGRAVGEGGGEGEVVATKGKRPPSLPPSLYPSLPRSLLSRAWFPIGPWISRLLRPLSIVRMMVHSSPSLPPSLPTSLPPYLPPYLPTSRLLPRGALQGAGARCGQNRVYEGAFWGEEVREGGRVGGRERRRGQGKTTLYRLQVHDA
jgi:hypothetical protein